MSEELRELSPRTGTSLCVVCYPDTYAAGVASLGFHVIHRLFSGLPGWSVQRAFGLSEEYQQCLVRAGAGAGTLEGGVPLSAAKVLAFSLPYSLLYREMLALLMAGGVTATVHERMERDPVVVVGGAAVTINPEPIAAFVDIAVVGEAERSMPRLLRLLSRWGRGRIARHELWEEAQRVPGVYAPTVGTAMEASRWDVPSMQEARTVSSFLTPRSHFGESLLLEMSRGCPGGCRFCVVGSLYGPVRWRPADDALALVQRSALRPERVSLIGAAVSQHPGLTPIVRELIDGGLQVGLSSLRVDRYDTALAAILARGGVRTVTMAPEAGSDRLRRITGKPLERATLVRAVRLAARSGVSKVRLYFMLGLPWETSRDRRAVVDLCAELSSAIRSTSCLLVPCLAPFVPKPMTPFAWCGPPAEQELRSVIQEMLKELGAIPRVRPRAGSPRLALADYRLSMGSRDLAETLLEMVRKGLTWRGWLRMTDATTGEPPCFPWGPSEATLRNEWDRARTEASG